MTEHINKYNHNLQLFLLFHTYLSLYQIDLLPCKLKYLKFVVVFLFPLVQNLWDKFDLNL